MFLVILGAILAVGTGFLVSHLEHTNKKNHFILGVIQEMRNFSRFSQQLQNILNGINTQQTEDWLDINATRILTNIRNSRFITNTRREWFLSINSDDLRDRVESFYLNTNEQLEQFTYIRQQRQFLLNIRNDFQNQIISSGITNQNQIQHQLNQLIPTDQSATLQSSRQLLQDILQNLINLQTEAQEIIAQLNKEFSWFKKIGAYLKHCRK